MTIVASAPGKVVLSGEYAVLDGAPAVAMAIDRRAVARVSRNPAGECHVTTLGYAAAGDEKFHLLEATCGGERPAGDFSLDTREFLDAGRKIGIGSSAALTVALLAALGTADNVFEAALHAHSQFQGGVGSGVDVAAAVTGGLLEYRMQGRQVTSLQWPTGLVFRIIWTGVAASTRARLAKLGAASAKASRGELSVAAERVAAAWGSQSAVEVLESYPDYIATLQRFSVDHDLGIFDAGHEQLAVAASAEGLVYKPAGAGGGDIGVLFGGSDAALTAFIAANAQTIHGVVHCGLDPHGVIVEPA